MKLVLRFGLMALLASLAIGHAEAAFFPGNPALNTVERTRFTAFPINHLQRGRMRVTLGLSGAPSFRRDYDRYRSTRHWRHLRGSHFDPFWDRPFYGRHWSERHFHRYAPWSELRSRRWHRRYGRTLRSLHLEWQQEFRPRIYPNHQTQVAHRAWCYQNYRSYRASDNSFQPYRGGRKRCRSPYGR